MKSLTELLQRSFSSWGTKLASVALIITVALFSLGAGAGDDNDPERGNHLAPRIEGSWLTAVSDPSMPPFPALLTFGAGGALVVTDSSLPPATGNVYQGTWARKGDHKITFTVLGLQFDVAGVLSGYIRIHETVRIERSGSAYNGIFALEFLDVNQNVVAGPFAGTTHGTRINAE